MAGNPPPLPPAGPPSLPPALPPAAAPLKVSAFSCKNCGAPVTLRAPGRSDSVACGSCGSLLDARDPNHQILSEAAQRLNIKPRIALGQRGVLKGVKWEVIGFMRRCDGTGVYSWDEYLLYNPYHGFRWLVESDGHWSFVRMLADRPGGNFGGTRTYEGRSYKEFINGSAKVLFVSGEFYWRVQVGDKVAVVDYVNPPATLSLEISDDEQVWSQGDYLPAAEIKAAFALNDIPDPQGVAPAQPFPGGLRPSALAGWCLLAFFILFVAQVFSAASASGKAVYEDDLIASPPGPLHTLVTPSFELSEVTGNLEIEATSPVDNSWVYLDTTLVNDATQEDLATDLELSYYHGVDDGESWSEGSNHASRFFSGIPAGKYHLQFEPQLPEGVAQVPFHLRVRRNVAVWGSFGLFALPLFGLMLILLLWNFSFEKRRWAASDHPLVQTGGDDD